MPFLEIKGIGITVALISWAARLEFAT